MIETERLRLRPFRDGDAADILEYLKEPAVNCFACTKLNSLEEARKAVQQRAEDTEYTFAIVLQTTGKVIGEIAAHPEASDPDSGKVIDLDTFSTCWMLNKNYHGKGYAYEAVKAFFDYLFYQSCSEKRMGCNAELRGGKINDQLWIKRQSRHHHRRKQPLGHRRHHSAGLCPGRG